MQNGRNIAALLASKYRAVSNMQRALTSARSNIIDSYINLRTVEREQVKDNEKSVGNSSLSQDKGNRQLSLGYYDKLDEMQFTLGAEVKTADILGDKKKVVVYGVPGVGKSTLCQHLAVSWANGRMLNGKFESVVWIVLKELIEYSVDAKDDAEYLSHIIRDKCMGGLESDKPELKEIVSYIKNAGQANKVLYVLDGFDEVAQLLESKPRLKGLFDYLFADESFSVILTSRRIHIGLNNIERELEAVGFTKENIVNYVNKFYPGKAEVLVKFINANSNLTNIAHIPLNLELMCSVLEEADLERQQNYSITQLYSAITEQLCKKMFDRENIQVLQREEEQETILNLLSGIAIHLMQTNRIQVIGKEIIALIKKQNPNLANLDILKKLLNLGVLRSVADKKDEALNSIYFIHHTIAEFYAGCYLANALNYGSEQQYKEAEKLISEHKYNPFYEVMMQYAVGILYLNAKASDDYLPLIKFWDVFESAPRELIGVTHDSLKFKLLEQCPAFYGASVTLQDLRKKLLDTASIVLNLFKMMEDSQDPASKMHAMEALVKLGIDTPDVITKLDSLRLHDKHLGVCLYAAESLLRLGQEHKPALKMLCDHSNNLVEYRVAALCRIYLNCADQETRRNIFEIFHSTFDDNNVQSNTILRLKICELLIQLSSHYRQPVSNITVGLLVHNVQNKILDCLQSQEETNKKLAIAILSRNLDNPLVKKILEKVLSSEYATPEIEVSIRQAKAMKCQPEEVNYIQLALAKPLLEERVLDNIAKVVGLPDTNKLPIKRQKIISIRRLGFRFSIGLTLGLIGTSSTIVGGILIAAARGAILLGAFHTIKSAYNGLFDSIPPQLDKIALSVNQEEKDKFAAICYKANQSTQVVLDWSQKGVLKLKLAIRLYSYSSQAVWLKPMKGITFIYKDPKILLTIRNKLIMCDDEQLTKNQAETNAVLGAMRVAYTKSNLDTKVFDHYLSGKTLEVSTSEERGRFRQKSLERALQRLDNERPLEYTELHKAAAEGNLAKVKELVEKGEIDIDDQHNETGNTPLMMALEGQYEDVIKYLVANNADLAFYNKKRRNAPGVASDKFDFVTNDLISKCYLKESRLEKLLEKAVIAYSKAKNNLNLREEIVANLALCLVNQQADWKRNFTFVKLHRIYLDDILSTSIDQKYIQEIVMKREETKEKEYKQTVLHQVNTPGSINMQVYPSVAHIHQKVRLYTYLELYMSLCAGLVTQLPKQENGNYYDLETIKSKLYYEIKTLTCCLALNHGLTRLGNEAVVRAKAKEVLVNLRKMPEKEELVISTGDKGHAVYVALHKLDRQRVLIRVDNRLLAYNHVINTIHGKEPFSIIIDTAEKHLDPDPNLPFMYVKRKASYIKSYCVGVADLDRDAKDIQEYVTRLILDIDIDSDVKYEIIYGNCLPKCITNISKDIENYIASWPYYPLQTANGRNCTMSSYNMGMLVRHGKEFFKWLITQELSYVPSLMPEDRSFVQSVSQSRTIDYINM